MDKNTLGDGLYAVLDTSKGEILLALELRILFFFFFGLVFGF